MVEKNVSPSSPQNPAADQPSTQQVRVRFDEREMKTAYANAFRTNGTDDEVILDVGMNFLIPGAGQETQPEIAFKVTDRIVMNYYSAKRLAIMLGQVIRRHEEQFGTLELDAAKRRVGK
jgi:hypothetical protein